MKKIMFNDKMCLTHAVIEGRKTQTRRIVSQSLIDKYDEWYDDVCTIAMPPGSTIETLRDWLLRKHTRYRAGEVVAVAQSYRYCGGVNENGIYVQYYAGKGDNACSFENPREAFAYLINKVSRKDVWQENPYVFVYDFELVK